MNLEEYLLKISGYKEVPKIPASSRCIIGLTSTIVLVFWSWLFYRLVIYIADGISILIPIVFCVLGFSSAYAAGNALYKKFHKKIRYEHPAYFQLIELITSVPNSEDLRDVEQRLANKIMSGGTVPIKLLKDKRNNCINETGKVDNSQVQPYIDAVADYCSCKNF